MTAPRNEKSGSTASAPRPYASALTALAGGGVGGLAGTLLAQMIVSLAHRAGLGSQTLHGRWGPPYFDVALFLGVLYGAIAAAISRRWKPALLGAAAPFLTIAVPMFVLERTVQMGWGTDAEYSGGIWRVLLNPWYAAVISLYTCAIWGTVALLGRALTGRWRGALGAAAGAVGAYLVMTLLQKADPLMDSWSWGASEFLPHLSTIIDGILTGAGLGLGIWIVARRNYEEISGS